MRLLIVGSTPLKNDGTLLKQSRLWLPGLGPPLLAALTPDDWDVRICNETIDDVPFDEPWDLVAVTAMGCAITRAWQIGDEFKKRGVTVILGGIQASLAPEWCEDHCDSVVIGEAEGIWPKVLEDFRTGNLQARYESKELADISNLPLPRFDLLDKGKLGWWLPVQAGRGCPYHCSFCAVASFYKNRYRKRPIDQIIRDVENVKRLGYDKILVLDDNIGSEPAFARDLFKELIPQKVVWMTQCALSIAKHPDLLDLAAESGCVTMSFGLETVNQGSLESVGKMFTKVADYEDAIRAIRAVGIDVSTEMVFGFDDDGIDVFDRTIEFIMRNKITVPRFYVLTPTPGTPLFEEFDAAKRIFNKNWAHYTGADVVFHPKNMTAEELQEGFWRVYRETFTLSSLFRRYFSKLPVRNLLVALFFLGVNFHYRDHIKQGICPGIV